MVRRASLYGFVVGLFTVVLSVFWGSEVYAQQGMAVLQGRVASAVSGNPLAGVKVVVTSPALQGEQTAVTDETGRYRIPSLPPGEYTVRAEKEEFQPGERKNLRLRADSTVRLDLDLAQAGEAVEEIMVMGSTSTVDVGSTQSITNITGELTNRVPIAIPTDKGAGNRSIEAMAIVAPEAKSDQYGTSIAGTTSPENSYVVDGISIGDPAFGLIGTPLTVEFVKELNIITSGYMPEYGKTTGGLLNAITKSGGNEFSGSVWAFMTPGALEGSREVVKREESVIITEPELRWVYDIGADTGGPIIHDKLWYYFGVSYAQTRYDLKRSLHRSLYNADLTPVLDDDGFATRELIPGTEKTYASESNVLQLLGKLTYTLDENNRFSLAVIASPYFSGGGSKTGMDFESGDIDRNLNGTFANQGRKFKNTGLDAILKWTTSSEDNDRTLDVTFGYHNQSGGKFAVDGSEVGGTSGYSGMPRILWQRQTPNPHSITEFETIGEPSLCDPITDGTDTVYPCETTEYYTGGAGFIEEMGANRYQLKAVGTLDVGDLLGNHIVKAGFEAEMTQFHHVRAYSGGYATNENTGNSHFFDFRRFGALVGPDDEVLYPTLDRTTNSYGIGGFLQDSWDVLEKFTLNFGVRYDAQYILGAQDNVALALPNQWSPRVGVIYDPTQVGDAKLFANYGIFYQNVTLAIADRAGSGDPMARGAYQSIGQPPTCDPNASTPATNGCYDRSLQRRRQFNGRSDPNYYWRHDNGRTPVDPDLSPQSMSEISAGGEYNVLRLARVGVVYTRRWANRVIEDMSRDLGQTYFIGNPGYGAAKDFPKAERTYDAITAYLTKPLSRNWLAQLSYTWASLRGNYAGLFRPETNQLDPNMNADFDLPSMLVNRSGPLSGDRRHTFKVFGAYDIDLTEDMGLNLGAGMTARSGDPTNYLGADQDYGTDELLILPRGSGKRLPWVYQADVSLGYNVRLADDYTIAITANVFNVLNLQQKTQIDETYTTTAVNPIVDGDKSQLGELRTVDGDLLDPAEINKNFGRTLQYQEPLTVRFGIRASF